MTSENRNLGIYIHIPFCVQKCNYCDFCSFAGEGDEVREKYVDALICEMEKYSNAARGRVVDTVYFGGGTPTLLKISSFERIFDHLRKSFHISESSEISCEANPATADYEYLRALRALGVNRLSIGLQSANEDELRALGRIHTAADFADTVKDARRAGFDNISADVMYGIPHQTPESLERTLRFVIDLGLEHISAYGLKIEDGTPFGKMRDTLPLPEEDIEADMYLLCTDLLKKSGYEKYEISNFAHKGYESAHNIKYWECREYLGIGVAAHSYFDGVRWANSREFASYLRGEDVVCERRRITPAEQLTEYVMLHMRTSRGVVHTEFESLFGKGFDEAFGKSLEKYIATGYVVKEGGRTFFSDRGMLVSNYILADILDFG